MVHVIISVAGIPVNTAANRAHAERCGWTNIQWPVPHPPDSVLMECHKCGGLVWIGPNAQDAVSRVSDALIMCLVCMILTTHGDIPAILRLSGNAMATNEGESGSE